MLIERYTDCTGNESDVPLACEGTRWTWNRIWNRYCPAESRRCWDRWKPQGRRYSSTIRWWGRKSRDYSEIHMILTQNATIVNLCNVRNSSVYNVSSDRRLANSAIIIEIGSRDSELSPGATYIDVRKASVKLATSWAAMPKPWITRPLIDIQIMVGDGMNGAGPTNEKPIITRKQPATVATWGASWFLFFFFLFFCVDIYLRDIS